MPRSSKKKQIPHKEASDAFVAGVRNSVDRAVAALNSKEKITLDKVELPKEPKPMKAVEIKRLRDTVLRVSQSVFAGLLNVSPKTIQAWEQGVNTPSGAHLRLLQVFRGCPKIAKDLLHGNFSC